MNTNTTYKRAAAAIFLDWIDRMECGGYDHVKPEHADAIAAELKKIIEPIADRLANLTGDNWQEHCHKYED